MTGVEWICVGSYAALVGSHLVLMVLERRRNERHRREISEECRRLFQLVLAARSSPKKGPPGSIA